MSQGSSDTRPSGVLRPCVASAEIVGIGAVAHTAAGGPSPSTGMLLALGALTAIASYLLRRQLLGLRTATALMVLAQVGLHTAFAMSGPGTTHLAPAAHGLGGLADPAMLLAHTVSAAVTLAAFRWQEQALVALVRWCRSPVPRPSYLVPAPAAAPATRVGTTGSFGAVLARAKPRRGPPATASAS